MKSRKKPVIVCSIIFLLLAALTAVISSGTCFFAFNWEAQENGIDDFDEVIPDFQFVADRLLDAYNETSSASDIEISFSLSYDKQRKVYYLCSDLITLDDDEFCASLTTIYNSFDNDFWLYYISVSENRVSFYNSVGNFAVVYSADHTEPRYFDKRHTKINHAISEDSGWYQIFI